MKYSFFTKIFCASAFFAFSQNIVAQGVGINTNSPDPSAALDVTATNKGMLIPRMTTAQRTIIASPATGLLVFDNTTGSFWFYTGAAWTELNSDSQNLSSSNTASTATVNISGGSATTFSINDADADPSNEYNTGISLSGSTLRVTDGGGTQAVNLAPLADQDWHEVGTTTAPNSINDNIFTQGNVAIGSNSPTARLSVLGSGSPYAFRAEKSFLGLGNTAAAFIGGTDASFANTGIYVLQKDAFAFSSPGTNIFNVVNNNIPQLVVKGNGNVGIGNNNPASKLHVSGGSIMSDRDATNGILGTIQLRGSNSSAAEPNIRNWSIYNMNEYGSYNGLSFWEYYDANGDGTFCNDGANNCAARVTFARGGNVGIGIPTPAERLDVGGEIQLQTELKFTSTSDLANGAEFGIRAGSSIDNMEIYEPEEGNKVWARFNDDNSFHLIGTPNLWVDGNTGLGTTAPSTRLDVNGQARIRTIPAGAAADQVLTVDASGNIRKRATTATAWSTANYDSGWFNMSSQAGAASFQQRTHGFGAYPSKVLVLVRATSGANNGFIFEAVGAAQSDDDNDAYSGVVFAYNTSLVRLWAPDRNNDNSGGRMIYVADGWGGEVNAQNSQTAQVRVLCWR